MHQDPPTTKTVGGSSRRGVNRRVIRTMMRQKQKSVEDSRIGIRDNDSPEGKGVNPHEGVKRPSIELRIHNCVMTKARKESFTFVNDSLVQW
jgi:hypothetical protein